MKERLDVLLVRQGFAPSREKAKAILMSGIVYVDGQKEDKAGTMVHAEKVKIEVRGQTLRYVSRGGLKLEKALQVFDIDLQGKTCLDIGASTGGFTDCMLQNGAVRVFAVDVGSGQLHEKLRADERVISLEQTDIRDFTFDSYDISAAEFIGTDVSFISLKLVLPHIYRLLAEGSTAVALIKPQFEAGRGSLSKKGIVRSDSVRLRCVEEVKRFAEQCGFAVIGTAVSPITGGDGNVEYLLGLRKERQ